MLKGWRSIIVSIAVFALGAIEYINPDVIAEYLQLNVGMVVMGIGLLTFVLRTVTSSPMGKKL